MPTKVTIVGGLMLLFVMSALTAFYFQFRPHYNIDLSQENIDGVRPRLKYDLYVLRTMISTEDKVDKNSSGETLTYKSYSFDISVHKNINGQVDRIFGEALDSSKFRTSQNIGKGSSLQQIEKAYGRFGEVKQSLDNGKSTVIYTDHAHNLELRFNLNSNNVVDTLSLSMLQP